MVKKWGINNISKRWYHILAINLTNPTFFRLLWIVKRLLRSMLHWPICMCQWFVFRKIPPRFTIDLTCPMLLLILWIDWITLFLFSILFTFESTPLFFSIACLKALRLPMCRPPFFLQLITFSKQSTSYLCLHCNLPKRNCYKWFWRGWSR